MEIQIKDIKGKAVKTLKLPEAIYSVPMNEHVLHLVVKSYQAARRQGTHCTKTRAFVSGGGKKPFKQKGTGGARQGTSRSPLMPGGAVIFGPQPRDYREKTNQKLRQLALKVALSDKVRHGKLVVVNDFALSKYSTKHVLGALSALGVSKAVLSDERKDDLLHKSTRNIHGTASVTPAELNAEHLLRYESLVISETALNTLHQRFEEK
ncbi:50S ribosomal protein L4 [bacterium]|nr:50S ribosomal protein L4 [bacterium]